MNFEKITKLTAELTKEAESIKRLAPIIHKTKVAASNLMDCIASLENALSPLDTEGKPDTSEIALNLGAMPEAKEDQGRIDWIRQIIKNHEPMTTKEVIEQYKKLGRMENLSEQEIKNEEQGIRYALNSLKSRKEIVKEGDIFTGVWKRTEKFKG